MGVEPEKTLFGHRTRIDDVFADADQASLELLIEAAFRRLVTVSSPLGGYTLAQRCADDCALLIIKCV